jgi:hypothetical protein
MPATSQEPSGRFASQSDFRTGGSGRRRGCRRDIRSNGCTALFDRARSFRKAVRQKKQVFFIGADPKVRNFTGAPCRSKFGPDVFADALVPRRGIAARRFDFPKIAKLSIPRPRGFMPRDVAAMVIALPNGRVNRIPRTARLSSKTNALRFRDGDDAKSVQIRFIAKLKLLFKFDRS